MWQDVIAAAAALLAAAYLCRRWFRRRGNCGPACDRCPAASPPRSQLVQLQPPADAAPRDSVPAAGD